MQVLAVDVFAPMGQLPEGVGHRLDRAELQRPVDLLRRHQALALGGDFPGQQVEDVLLGRVLGLAGRAVSGVGGAGVFVPGERVAQQRLAEPEMVQPRIPLGLGEEVVQPRVGGEAVGDVVGAAFELEAGRLVLQFVPLALVVLFEEVAVADPAQLGRQPPVVGQHLAVIPEQAIAVVLLERQVALPAAEIVVSVVLDAPVVDQAGGSPRPHQEPFAVVGVRPAVSEAALAEVVEADVEIGAGRPVSDAQQLIAVPVGQDLGAEDAVVLQPGAANVERRLLQVGGDVGPIEERHVAEEQEGVAARGQLLLLDDRLVGLRVDRHAGP